MEPLAPEIPTTILKHTLQPDLAPLFRALENSVLWRQMGVPRRCSSVLKWRNMRILAALGVIIFSLLSVGCEEGVIIQPPQQGEWSNFHNDKHQISKPSAEPEEKPAAEK
jgi:hypothetical protein